MGVRIYNATGTYPNITASGGAVYTFNPEPATIKYNYVKALDYDEIPWEFLPDCWDSYNQVRKITISGEMTATEASTLKTRMEDLDKLSFYKSTFTNQPQYSDGDEKLYILGVDFPTSGGTEEKQSVVVFLSQDYTFGAGTQHLTYTIVFREVMSVAIL